MNQYQKNLIDRLNSGLEYERYGMSAGKVDTFHANELMKEAAKELSRVLNDLNASGLDHYEHNIMKRSD